MHGRVCIEGTDEQFEAMEMALRMMGFSYSLTRWPHGPGLWYMGYGFINEEVGDIEPEYTYWRRMIKVATLVGMDVRADGVFAPKEK